MSEAASVFNRCTDRARRTLRLAAAIGHYHGRSDINGNDLLLALWNDGCVAGAALDYAECKRPVLPTGLTLSDDEAAERSPLAKRLMDQAKVEAHLLGHSYPGTEHQLLALMRIQPELVADANRVRREVLMILGHNIPDDPRP